MAAHRLGQVEAYFTVREVLSETSTVRPELAAEGSRRWFAIARTSDIGRSGLAMLGLRLAVLHQK